MNLKAKIWFYILLIYYNILHSYVLYLERFNLIIN